MPSFFRRLTKIGGPKGDRPQLKKPKEEKKEIVKPKSFPAASPPPTQTRAQEIILQAQNEAFKIREAAEEEARRVRKEVLQLQDRIAQKEEGLDKKAGVLEERERQLAIKEATLQEKLSEIEEIK